MQPLITLGFKRIVMPYWLDTYCVPRLKQNTINGYRVNIERHILPYIGEIQLNRLKPNDIQKLYASLSAAGLGDTSIRYVHNNLHRALGYAVKQQLIVRNPADLVFAPTVDSYEAVTLTPVQAQALLKYCEDKELFIPVMLGLVMGMRRGEVLGLQWQNVEWDERTIRYGLYSSCFDGTTVLSGTPIGRAMCLRAEFLLSPISLPMEYALIPACAFWRMFIIVPLLSIAAPPFRFLQNDSRLILVGQLSSALCGHSTPTGTRKTTQPTKTP